MNGDVLGLYWPNIWKLGNPAGHVGASGGSSVFDGAPGTLPTNGTPAYPPSFVGQEAFNEQSGEKWIVNNSLAWQIEIGI